MKLVTKLIIYNLNHNSSSFQNISFTLWDEILWWLDVELQFYVGIFTELILTQ